MLLEYFVCRQDIFSSVRRGSAFTAPSSTDYTLRRHGLRVPANRGHSSHNNDAIHSTTSHSVIRSLIGIVALIPGHLIIRDDSSHLAFAP